MKITLMILLLVTITVVSSEKSRFNRRRVELPIGKNWKSSGVKGDPANGGAAGMACDDDEGKAMKRVVSVEDLNRFLARARNLSMRAIAVFNKAGNELAHIKHLVADELLNEVSLLMGDLQKLGDLGEEAVDQAKIMVARSFLVGIAPERRCMRRHMQKRGKERCDPVLTARRKVESRQNSFISCLFGNVGDMMDSVMEIYQYVQYSVSTEWPGGFGCSNMYGIYDYVQPLDMALNSTGGIDPVLINMLSADLQCIGATLADFNELCGDWKFTDASPYEIRFHLAAGLALMEMIMEQVMLTLSHAVELVKELRGGSSGPHNNATHYNGTGYYPGAHYNGSQHYPDPNGTYYAGPHYNGSHHYPRPNGTYYPGPHYSGSHHYPGPNGTYYAGPHYNGTAGHYNGTNHGAGTYNGTYYAGPHYNGTGSYYGPNYNGTYYHAPNGTAAAACPYNYYMDSTGACVMKRSAIEALRKAVRDLSKLWVK